MENRQPNTFSFGQKSKKASDYEFNRKGFVDLTLKEETKLEQLEQYQVSLRKNIRDENFKLKRAEKLTEEEKATAELDVSELITKIEQAVNIVNQSNDFDTVLKSISDIRKAITLKNEVLVSIILGNKYLGFAMKVLNMESKNQIAFEWLWSIWNLVWISDKIGLLLIKLGFHLKIYEILLCEGVDLRIASQWISWIRNMAQIPLFFQEISIEILDNLNEEHGIESSKILMNKIWPIKFIDWMNNAFNGSSDIQHKIMCLIWVFQMSKSIMPLSWSLSQKVIQFIQNIFNSANESQIIWSWYNVIMSYAKIHKSFWEEILKYPIFHRSWCKSQLNDYILKFDIIDLKILNKKLEFIQFLVINGKLSFDILRIICEEISNLDQEKFDFVSQTILTIIALITQKSFDNKEVSSKLFKSISLKKLLPLILQPRSMVSTVQNTMIIILNIFKSNSVNIISELYRNQVVEICWDALSLKDQKIIHLWIKCLQCLISYWGEADRKINELESNGYTQDDIIYSKWCPYLIIPSRSDIVRAIMSRCGDTLHDLEFHPSELIQKQAADLSSDIEAEKEDQFNQIY